MRFYDSRSSNHQQDYERDTGILRSPLRSGERIVVEDVEQDASYAAVREVAHAAGYRGFIATPLRRIGGEVLGMISIYFKSAHQPSEQDLRRLDLYVRQASDFIQRCRIEEQLRQSQERFQSLVNATSYAVYRMSPDWSEMR